MRKPRKTTLPLVLLAAAALVAVIIMLVLKQEPEVRQPGEPQTILQAPKNSRLRGISLGGASLGLFPTYQVRIKDKLVIYRLNPEGVLERIGEHTGERPGDIFLGAGKYYGLMRRGSDDNLQITIYDAGTKVHEVSERLMRGHGGPINPLAVLAKGNLFAIYSGLESFGMTPSSAAIIQFDSEGGPRRHELYLGKEWNYVLSGDGSVVSIIADGATSFYSGEDGHLLRKIENFRKPAMSYDGRTIIGIKGEDIAVYRDGQLVAETPLGVRFFSIRLSMNGSYAAVLDEPWETLQILETRSLQPVHELKVSPGYDMIIDSSASSDGKVALLEHKQPPAGKGTSNAEQRKLLIYNSDGSLLFQREFEPLDFLPVIGMTWSLDGSCLIYLDQEQNTVVRLVFAP